ncbi:hypothetical protein [Leifsonia sp. NPDC058248]|uniref:hypothetical protein n=1 Tax=Leifsonia sp. NPDC058248 TaxID=3346402 RepID=UPI0036DE95F0
MTDTERSEPVSVVLEQDVPVRLVWKGTRYYVDEPPIALGRTRPTAEGETPHPALVTGWRIRCSSVDGDLHLFEVKNCGRARWSLASVQDCA